MEESRGLVHRAAKPACRTGHNEHKQGKRAEPDVFRRSSDVPRFENAALLIDAKFHLALEHSNELFVWMRMSGHMRSRSYLPPHHHALLASYHPARNLVGDFFLRDRRKRPETCERSHGVFSFELPERPHGRNLALPEQGRG